MDSKYKAIMSVILSVLCVCVATYLSTKWHYEKKYRDLGEMQKRFDSLSIIISIQKEELQNLNTTYDSIKKVSQNQTTILDSLLLARKNKRNEKNIKRIDAFTDIEIDSILSSRLK